MAAILLLLSSNSGLTHEENAMSIDLWEADFHCVLYKQHVRGKYMPVIASSLCLFQFCSCQLAVIALTKRFASDADQTHSDK